MLSSIFSLRDRIREAKATVTPDGENGGIKIDHWFWGAANRISNAADKNQKTFATKNPAMEAVGKLLGKTLKKKKKEADSASAFPLVQVKQSKINIRSNQFREAAKSQTLPTKFRVVLIEEGLGNMRDAFYYTKDALESAVDVFNGLKIMADHPTVEEEEIRPERSTRDILGHYENLGVEESDDGCALLCADVDIVPSVNTEWARALMVRAIENATKFPGKDFIGLSINAAGDAETTPIEDVISQAPEGAQAKLAEAQSNGIETVRVVHQIYSAMSCDLVTEAGAGGKITNFIKGDESDAKSKS